LNEEDIQRIEQQSIQRPRGARPPQEDETPLGEDQINSLWRYKLKGEDLPEKGISRARRKRD
jgi:hypothetical protein